MRKLAFLLFCLFGASPAIAQTCTSQVCTAAAAGVSGLVVTGGHTLVGAHVTGSVPANGLLMLFDGNSIPVDQTLSTPPPGCFTISTTVSPNTTSTGVMANFVTAPVLTGIVAIVSDSNSCLVIHKITSFYFSISYQ